MIFDDVLNDIEQLVGLELQSIRPGANIRLIEVNRERDCILLENKSGETKSRPISEIRTIWNHLANDAAVHVEGVLHGSGTSRNQPETIMANLPYVEWLKISNKKHIAFVGKKTHPYGTLKHMEAVQQELLLSERKIVSVHEVNEVIVTGDLSTITMLQNTLSGTVRTVQQNVYDYESKQHIIRFIHSSFTSLPIGTYILCRTAEVPTLPSVTIGETKYYYLASDGCNVLFEVK